MIFSFNDESNTVSATIPEGQNAGRYACTLSSCPSPVCGCQVVTLDLALMYDAGDNSPSPSRQVKIDLAGNSLEFKDIKKLSPENRLFAESFFSGLGEDDFDWLVEKHFAIKNRLTEEAKPDSIDAHFDFPEIERDGLRTSYLDVLPYGDRLYATLSGKKYLIIDQYCLRHKCSCTGTSLSFMFFDPVARKAEDLCHLEVGYRKKTWELREDSPALDLDALRCEVETQIPHIYESLRQRHERLKAIYVSCRKKHSPSRQPVVVPKVGRNDPCPCGSGKKFKKCCSVK